VAGAGFVEAGGVGVRLHRGVVRLEVDGADEERDGLVASHQELVDAAQLLLGEGRAGLGDDEAVEIGVDLVLAGAEVDVLELVEGEGLLEDALHVRALPAALGGDQVGLGELHLVLAGEDAELLVQLVGAVADLADLVGDPELEALRRVGRDRDHGNEAGCPGVLRGFRPLSSYRLA